MNRIRKEIEAWLQQAIFGPEWQEFQDACDDDFTGTTWKCSPKVRMINDKKVAVVMSHEGEHHACWRLFADGKFVKELPIDLQMGSGQEAMRAAEQTFA